MTKKSAQKKYLKSGKLKEQIGINLDVDVLQYFRDLADKRHLPYQSLINLALREQMKCGLDVEVVSHRDQTELDI